MRVWVAIDRNTIYSVRFPLRNRVALRANKNWEVVSPLPQCDFSEDPSAANAEYEIFRRRIDFNIRTETLGAIL